MKLLSRVGWLVLAAMVFPSCASFADHGHYRYGDRGRRDAFRVGYDRGYQEGRRHGLRDSSRHEDFNFWHDSRYRRADLGYRGWQGSRIDYRRGFRSGYERGYRAAFSAHRHHDGCRDADRYDGYDREDRERAVRRDRREGRDGRWDWE